MKYLRWLLKLFLLLVVIVIVVSWVTNPWNINQIFTELSTGNIILISKAMLPIAVLVSLVAIPLVLRPLPFHVSDTNSKFFRILYLIVSYGIVNVLQKAFFRQNEIILSKAENTTIVVITIIILFVIYKTFASRAWLGEGEIVLTQEEKEIQEGKKALRAFGKKHKTNSKIKEMTNERNEPN